MQHSLRRAVTAIAAGAVTVTASVTLLATGAAADAASRPPVPDPYGTAFQKDPGHDFAKGISPRRDGVLRGRVTHYDARTRTAEYEPIKWVKGRDGGPGRFAGPPEYDATAYRSRVSPAAVLYSARNCDSKKRKATVDRRGLGTRRCGGRALITHLKAGERPALITIRGGRIVRIQEIHVP
jgi:hypothetical protein